MHKPAQTSVDLHPLIASRWSPRAFDDGRPIPPEAAAAMMEAARWAPSCFGAEPWRFVFCDKEKDSAAWEKALACLAEANRKWAKNAPLLVVAFAQTHFDHNGKPNRHCAYDAGAASFSLVMEAEHRGLRCHQMGGFDTSAMCAALGAPEGFDCLSVIAVGVQAEARTLPDDLREREESARARLPAGETFFGGFWGKPGF